MIIFFAAREGSYVGDSIPRPGQGRVTVDKGVDSERRAIRVMLVDDHHLVRAGYHRLLEGAPGIEVVAEAADASECLKRMQESCPDVAVVDLTMPGSGGFDLIQRMKARHPEVRVLVLSMHSSGVTANQAFRVGASGYLTKSARPQLLPEAIRSVYRDDAFLDPALASQLDPQADLPGKARLSALTRREYEVFMMLAQGSTVPQIAESLNISRKTAGIHYTRIMQKLAVRNLAELARLAIRWGVIDA